MSLRPFLRFRVSRPGLFYDLSTGDSCPLRIPPTSRGLRFPPLISREKHGGLPTVTQKRSQSHASYISATGVSPWVSTIYQTPLSQPISAKLIKIPSPGGLWLVEPTPRRGGDEGEGEKDSSFTIVRIMSMRQLKCSYNVNISLAI